MTAPAGTLNPVVPDTTKIAVEQHIGDARMVNTFYCRFPSPGDSDLADMAAAVRASWGNLVAHLSDAWQIDQTVATDISVLGGHQVVNSSVLAGTATDNPIPYQAAALCTWRTARVGRNFRGRSYVGGFTEAGSAGGAPTNVVVGHLEDWADDIKTSLDALGLFVVVSRVELNPTPPPPSRYRATNLTTAIASHTIRPGWATQRRRTIVE